eukprot:GHRR01006880.1.p1 GENE.GHRR01006880.1~~GHRR01006880.1.p1  ORF type:complete len:308 (+),score=105.40 GHRR01006880.1:460-1383(+)
MLTAGPLQQQRIGGLHTCHRYIADHKRPVYRAKAQDPDSAGQDAEPQPNLSNPAGTIVWGGKLPNSRRAAVGGLTAVAIALGGNLGGITSWLLGLDHGQLAGKLHLDVLVPVSGFKRCVDNGNGYEFQYPAEWLADRTLLYRAAQRAEAARGLDPPALKQQRRQVVEPSAAFGPAGSSGEENISVIVAPIFEGFKLQGLGTPSSAAQQFLDTIAAPAGSDKTAILLSAQQRSGANSTLYYQFEFIITAPTFSRHNVAVLASQGNLLYTLTAQCPESRWQEDGDRLQQAAASFRLMQSGRQQYPGTLR